MFFFQSMTHITLFTTLMVIIFLALSAKTDPIRMIIRFVKLFITSRAYLFHFAALSLILIINKYELNIEEKINLKVDFASLFYKIEGNFVSNIQHIFYNPSLTLILSFVYVIVFPALMVSSICIYSMQNKMKMYYATCYAIMINYIVAIPFYLFFPVNEVWFFHPQVDFLIPEVFPLFEQVYRPLSGLDNCFPSLHTSISVTVALLAAQSGNHVWKWISGGFAALIVFSIFYLGIHWLIDMLGGTMLAVVASQVGLRLADRTDRLGSFILQPVLSKQNVSENG